MRDEECYQEGSKQEPGVKSRGINASDLARFLVRSVGFKKYVQAVI